MIAHTDLPAYLVSVDATASDLERAVALTGAAGVQPHGRHRHDVAVASASHGWSVLFPIPMGDETPVDPDAVPGGVVPLLDSASGAVHGGTGSTFDWSRIDDRYRPFVLAGGLGVDNVAEAIRTVQPYGVDASSRLEAAPGVKDPDTIRRFIEQAKSA